eukprot:526990-Pelagomonas_calceolata.AAC.1
MLSLLHIKSQGCSELRRVPLLCTGELTGAAIIGHSTKTILLSHLTLTVPIGKGESAPVRWQDELLDSRMCSQHTCGRTWVVI